MLKPTFARLLVVMAICLTMPWMSSAQVRTAGKIVVAVEDAQGATIPGAQLTLVDMATNQTRTGISESDGEYVFTDLPSGTYKLTVTLQGFKTGVFPGIKVDIGGTTNVTAKLEIGTVSQTVIVEGAAEVLQTTSTAIESTVQGRLLRSLPLNNRNAIDFVMLDASAQQGGSARQGTFLGLPKGAINITMDGINIQDNLLKSSFGGGLFAIIQPRIDIVEEVNLTTAAGGAEGAGEGAVQIKFTTRRGSNDYHGSAFWYHRNEYFNANTWFNNAAFPQISRPRNLLNQYGGNVRGRIIKDKLFFFGAIEDFRLPGAITRVATLLTNAAAGGLFPYKPTATQSANPNAWTTCDSGTAPNQICTANLLSSTLLGTLPNTIDPTVSSFLSAISSARGSGSVSTFDLFRDRLRWDAPSSQRRWFPTARIDWNITQKVHWNVVGNWNNFSSFPDTLNSMDPSLPGFKLTAGQYSKRWSVAMGVNWEIKPNLTYEFRIGRERSHVKFFPESTPSDLYPNGLRVFFDALGLQSVNTRPGLSATSRALPSERDTPTVNHTSNVGWLMGKHTINFGEIVSVYTHWDKSFGNAGIPIVTFGIDSADPAAATISSGNLPAINTTDLGNARALYALLTGRLNSISGSNNVEEASKTFQPAAPLTQRNRQNEFGLYITDSWRARPNLTINAGLRWEYQGVPFNRNGIYTSPTFASLWGKSGVNNLFAPGSFKGVAQPTIDLRTKDLYDPGLKNFAPGLGIAWTPHFANNKIWNTLFGGKDRTVFRAGYSIAYTREGLAHWTTYAGGSPGLTQSITLNPGDAGFTPGSLLLKNPIPPLLAFPSSFSFPTPMSNFTFSGNDVFSIDPNLKVPYVQSWSFGIQRELSQSTVLEVRYVGNHGTRLWRGFNINEVNIFENGFVTEFQNAQNNLNIFTAANPNCGKTGQPACSFANTGLSGQVPLPILSAAFGALGSQPALSSSQGFANGTFVTLLQQGQAGNFANRLATSSTFLCRMAGNALQACADRNFTVAGVFPANFFQVNPDAAGPGARAFLLSNAANSTYNGLQVELRRRLSKGLFVVAHYTFSRSLTDLFADDSQSTISFTTLRNRGLDKGPSPWDIRHSSRTQFLYELPFGPGRKWNTGSFFLNKAIEGWELSGIIAVQSGRVYKLTSGRATFNQNDSGVLLKGLNQDQLQSLTGVVKPAGTPGKSQGFVLFVSPSLIGPDGRSNTTFLAPPTTPGQFGSFVYLRGPRFVKPDISVAKRTTITERVNVELRAAFFNAFNYQNFFVGAPGSAGITQNITSTTFGQTSTIFNDLGNQDPGPRMIELSLRINF